MLQNSGSICFRSLPSFRKRVLPTPAVKTPMKASLRTKHRTHTHISLKHTISVFTGRPLFAQVISCCVAQTQSRLHTGSIHHTLIPPISTESVEIRRSPFQASLGSLETAAAPGRSKLLHGGMRGPRIAALLLLGAYVLTIGAAAAGIEPQAAGTYLVTMWDSSSTLPACTMRRKVRAACWQQTPDQCRAPCKGYLAPYTKNHALLAAPARIQGSVRQPQKAGHHSTLAGNRGHLHVPLPYEPGVAGS